MRQLYQLMISEVLEQGFWRVLLLALTEWLLIFCSYWTFSALCSVWRNLQEIMFGLSLLQFIELTQTTEIVPSDFLVY